MCWGITLVGCGGGSSNTTSTSTPIEPVITIEQPPQDYTYQQPEQRDSSWTTGHIDDFDVELTLLETMMNEINKGAYSKIDSVLIVRSGTLIFEEQLRTTTDSQDTHINNTDPNVHSLQSVSKSLASALVGIAIEQGHIASVDTPFYDFFSEYDGFANWDERKSRMTLENVLNMRHGWQWDEWSYPYSDSRNSLGEIYRRHLDRVKGLLDLPMQTEPGSTFAYSTIASVALGAAVENSSGMPLEDFAETYLFEPVGITSARWGMTPVGRAHTGGGLFMSSRDMARFGQLYLNKGQWNGQQIIPESWVETSIQSRVYLDYGHSEYYGYQWWMKTFDLADGRSIDTFSAQGNGGQFIFVAPQLDTVIVFTGSNYNDMAMYQPTTMMLEHVLPAIK